MRHLSEVSEATVSTLPETANEPQGETVYRISVRDLEVDWSIGVYDHEHRRMQRIVINLDLEAKALINWEADNYDAVPCYASISKRIQELAEQGHVELVETLASRIADICLEDTRILSASVRVEKPEALTNAAAVGVQLTRSR